MNHYLLPARKAANVPIDNTGLDAAARGQDPRAQQLREAVADRVEQCLESSPDGCMDINQVLVQACQETFPANAKPLAPQNDIVQHLWRLRAEARYTAVQAKRTGRLFAAWKAAIRYHLAAKKATKACHAKKRQEILDLLQLAEDAAQQGDQRKVYQMVKKTSPEIGFSLRMTTASSPPKKKSTIALSASAKLSSPRKQNNLTENRKSFPWSLLWKRCSTNYKLPKLVRRSPLGLHRPPLGALARTLLRPFFNRPLRNTPL